MDESALAEQLAAAQAQVAQLSEELEETNHGVLALYAELKSRFLAYMSHEFRTPLGAIQSMTRLLLDRLDGPLTAEQERQVQFIHQNALEFSEIVNDLLDLAKVEAGRIDVSPGWFDMVDLFAALRGMFKPVLTNPQVSLIFEDPIDVPQVFSDDRKLAQILRNYISNALKFTLRGEVRVSARRVSEDGQDWVRFAVADTGIGIAREYHGAIFQDFSQIDSPIQKSLRGTGLGLSLSKRLAELLGGSVGMDSVPDQGSTFHVRIPLRGAPAGDDTSS
jgi:signal transduction histidine kinase